MIKAIIFDLNGIFILSPKLSDRFEVDFKIPSETFMPKLSEIMASVRQPNAGSAFSYWHPILQKWGITMTEQEFWDYWFKAEAPSTQTISLAKKLRAKGIKVFVLSNNFKERADYYGHYPWMHDAIDKAYFSWQTGFVKPDARAWQAILNESNLEPSECLYFDDQQKNIDAATSVGIKSFIFTGEADLEKIILDHIKN
jgi:HAD superfamily hydrolase (TIGR01509 family)